MKLVLGFLLAFAIGAACRWFEIPVPAPPKLVGALLVLTATLGYLFADSVSRRPGSPSLSSAAAENRSAEAPRK